MKKLIIFGIVGMAFAIMVSACSHSGDTTSSTSTVTTGLPVVVVNPSTIEPTTTTTTAPLNVQINLGGKWVIEAKRASNFNPSQSKKYFPVYKTPGGDQLRNLRDYKTPDGDQPSDPTFYNSRLTFLVISTADEKGNKYPGGRQQDEWAEVILSTRPNNTRAWIRTADFDFKRYEYHITIDISDRMVTVTKGDEVIVRTAAIIGKASAPTPPIGLTYIEAKLDNTPRNSYGTAYGSRIFTLAAFSEALPSFAGNIPQLAIHGTDVPNQIGEAISSGCIRIPNEIIDMLNEKLITGTPVTIVA